MSSRGARGNPEEEDGDDFLKLQVPKSFTKQAKTSISSVVAYHGKKKLSPKNPGYGAEQRRILEYMIPFASALTGNGDRWWNVACCIDAETVRNYDLRQKDYTLPPCQVGFKDTSTLQSSMVKAAKDGYKFWLDIERKEYEKVHGVGSFAGASDFDSQLQPLLGEITRFHIKYWYIHPNLSRKQAYLDGKALLESKFKKKGDCKRIIDQLLLEKKVEGYTKDLMSLEMEDAPDDYENKPHGAKVFAENESAQVVLASFIKVYGIELPKDGILDYLIPLQAWINNGATDEEKNKFGKFVNMVPKQTAAYLKRKADFEEKEATKARKKRKAEERKLKAEEKKKQKLESFKEKLGEAANDENLEVDDTPTEAAEVNNPRATAKRVFVSGFDGSLRGNVINGTNAGQRAGTSGAILTPEEIDDIFKNDPYAEYKLKIKSFEIVDALPNGKRRSVRKLPSTCAPRRDSPEDHSGINKTIVSITTDGMVTVTYTVPGTVWTAGVKARLSTVIHSVNIMEMLLPPFVTHALPPAGHDGRIDEVIAKVVMAVFMHAMAQNARQLKAMRLHDSFHGPTLVEDLTNTLELWYPPLLRGNWVQLYIFRGLMNSKAEAAGQSLHERRVQMSTLINSGENFTSEQAKTIFEIVQLLEVVDFLYDNPDKQIRGRDYPFDPFFTKSEVYQNMELVTKKVVPAARQPAAELREAEDEIWQG
jgi:hypothetical protein